MVEQGTPSSDFKTRGNGAWWVVAAIGLCSLALGIGGFMKFVNSDEFLVRSAHDFNERGALLDMEGCVEAVLQWYGECEIGESICGKSVDHMMASCLAGADRSSECQELGPQLSTTHLDFERCSGRGLNPRDDQELRKTSNACASTYRTFDNYCRHGGRR